MDCKALLANRILCGRDLEEFRDGCILVRNNIIERILPKSEFLKENHEGCEVIDLGGRTLMPGMIECHNHVALDARLPGHLEMMEKSECELTILSLKTLHDDLMSGVTTARCMGDRHYIDTTLKHEIERGAVTGPRLLAAGIGMRSLHGHGFVGVAHTGAEEFRRTSRENMRRGADLLKLFVTPGCPPVGGGHIPHYLTREEILTVVEEAQSLNLMTAAHCIGGQALQNCVECGVDVIEHAYAVTDADIELLLKYDCWVDLTSGIFMDPSREPFISEKSADATRRCRANVILALEKVVKSGVKFSIGTDAYHTFLYKEVEYAVQLGADRLTALKGITSNAAAMSGISAQTGSLAVGLDADIIAVDANPLTDANALSNVTFVMKQGVSVL